MTSIRFIHMADLHLDSPYKGLSSLPKDIFLKIRESTFLSFKRLIDAAISEQVDFIIISGDIYDGEDRSLIAQSRFKREMEKLRVHGIHVYLIHGNHDHLSGNWAVLEWPDNVHIFAENVECKTFHKLGHTVHLYGFSYPRREVVENMALHYNRIEGADYHIGLLHGQVEGNTEHKNYAPFTIKDLEKRDFDYWALGHVHQRQQITSNIFYPGNIQGRNRKEFGEKGGNLVVLEEGKQTIRFLATAPVVLEEGKQTIRFLATAPVRWENEVIDISEIENIQQLILEVERRKEDYRYQTDGFFLTIYLEGNLQERNMASKDELAEMVQILNEEEDNRESFVWVVNVDTSKLNSWDRDKLLSESHFLGDIVRLSEGYLHNAKEIQEALREVFEHPLGRKFIDCFSDDELEEIIKASEKELLSVLMEEGND